MQTAKNTEYFKDRQFDYLETESELNPEEIKDLIFKLAGKIFYLESDIKKRNEEIERLQTHNQTSKNQINSAKKYMIHLMNKFDLQKLSNYYCKVTKISGKQKLGLDPNLRLQDIPAKYIEQKPTINKQLIKEDLLAGVKLDFAELEQGEDYLRIK